MAMIEGMPCQEIPEKFFKRSTQVHPPIRWFWIRAIRSPFAHQIHRANDFQRGLGAIQVITPSRGSPNGVEETSLDVSQFSAEDGKPASLRKIESEVANL